MLKNIPTSDFSDDDGSADPELAAALADHAAAPTADTENRLLPLLSRARLLVPVVAVLGEVETGPDGLKREKTSDMAVPTLQAPDGRRALPAFTSMETLHRWRPDARPVAVPLRQALLAAAHEKADTVVIDLAGPATYQLTGAALRALAEGRESTDPRADPAVADALRALLDAEPDVLAARLDPSAEADATLSLGLAPDATPAAVAQRLAPALAADETLRSRLIRGLDLALLPPGTDTTGAFFTR
ncbi:SseB family protein [Streptomyces albofaciens JCM 4342]|uniref:SseB family protein n=1 Tax=Streptomyces albofaciens TaxID=66866 RepID=UPI0012393736|nr:SseB family protein [Streptomyces albofaciens]KAA6222904.1 SseB family protein [Streptomyces albofaciens JCM 4342]